MLGWFAAKCPVTSRDQAWIEGRMRWLADRLGIDRLLRAEVLLPSVDSFPDPYEGTEADARRLLDRLCRHLGIDPASVDFEVYEDAQARDAVGLYEQGEGGKPLIRVAASQLAAPMCLVATLAHELAHELLLGRGLLTDETPDHEWVADLLPVYLGLGLFAANATLSESTRHPAIVGLRELRGQGYLASQQLGYALALFAFLRGEHHPDWAGHLRLDAASALRQGLRYLRKSGAPLFRPETVRTPLRPPTAEEAVRRLREGSPAIRIATLWDVSDFGLAGPDLVAEVVACLDDSDPYVPAEAARGLARFGPSAEAAVPRLIALLGRADASTRADVATALGDLRCRPEEVVPALCRMLGDGDRGVVDAAASALREFGNEAAAAAGPLVVALRSALVRCEYSLIDDLAEALRAVSPDPAALADDLLVGEDDELRDRLLEALRGPQS